MKALCVLKEGGRRGERGGTRSLLFKSPEREIKIDGCNMRVIAKTDEGFFSLVPLDRIKTG